MYQANVFIHIIAACVWVGGQIFMVAVIVPALRGWTGPERAKAFSAIGLQFRYVGDASLGLLVLTGIINAHYRGVRWTSLIERRFYQMEWGQMLTVKVALVILVVVLNLIHDLRLGPASVKLLRQADEKNEALIRAYRKRASVLARVTLLLSLAIVFLAVALVRGLPW